MGLSRARGARLSAGNQRLLGRATWTPAVSSIEHTAAGNTRSGRNSSRAPPACSHASISTPCPCLQRDAPVSARTCISLTPRVAAAQLCIRRPYVCIVCLAPTPVARRPFPDQEQSVDCRRQRGSHSYWLHTAHRVMANPTPQSPSPAVIQTHNFHESRCPPLDR